MFSLEPAYRYTWLLWSAAFLVPWAVVFIALPKLRSRMAWASLLTTPFGLTEPLFVPEYWRPPSLFDLAQRTGFDLESLVFSFAIGGLAAAAYRTLARAPESRFDLVARQGALHRWHGAALSTPFLVFLVLLQLPWNPIYAGIGALFAGSATTLLCRPDLTRSALTGGVLFFAIYVVFLLGLKWLWPGYIEAVWNLSDLLPWRPGGLPSEELMFGFFFGMYWSSVYEHIAWRRDGAKRVSNGKASVSSPSRAEFMKSNHGDRSA